LEKLKIMLFEIEWDVTSNNSELKSILDDLISDDFLQDLKYEIKNEMEDCEWEFDEEDVDDIIFDNFNWDDLIDALCKRILDKLSGYNVQVYPEDYNDFSNEEIKFIIDYIKPKLNLNLNYESTNN
jgi:hypothetical protein